MAKYLKRLDSRFHGNDKKRHFWTFYECINIRSKDFFGLKTEQGEKLMMDQCRKELETKNRVIISKK